MGRGGTRTSALNIARGAWSARSAGLSDPLGIWGPMRYYEKVRSYGPIAYWPMWEAAGLVSHDVSGNSPAGERDGVYTGVTLGQPGIGDGRTSPYFDGINDYVDILTGALVAAFNGPEGSAMVWWYHDPTSHGDVTTRRMLRIRVDPNNYLLIAKTGTNSNVQADYAAGGVVEAGGWAVAAYRDYWSHLMVTWSKSNDRVRYYDQGGLLSTDTVLGNWVGDPGLMVIGASDLVPNQPYHGWLAHWALWDREVPQDEVAILAVV